MARTPTLLRVLVVTAFLASLLAPFAVPIVLGQDAATPVVDSQPLVTCSDGSLVESADLCPVEEQPTVAEAPTQPTDEGEPQSSFELDLETPASALREAVVAASDHTVTLTLSSPGGPLSDGDNLELRTHVTATASYDGPSAANDDYFYVYTYSDGACTVPVGDFVGFPDAGGTTDFGDVGAETAATTLEYMVVWQTRRCGSGPERLRRQHRHVVDSQDADTELGRRKHDANRRCRAATQNARQRDHDLWQRGVRGRRLHLAVRRNGRVVLIRQRGQLGVLDGSGAGQLLDVGAYPTTTTIEYIAVWYTGGGDILGQTECGANTVTWNIPKPVSLEVKRGTSTLTDGATLELRAHIDAAVTYDSAAVESGDYFWI